MGVLEDCTDFVSLMGPGKALFHHGTAAGVLDGRLADLIGLSVAPVRTTTIFVAASDVNRPELRTYLRGEIDMGRPLTMTIFGPTRFPPVTDVSILTAAGDFLGAAVNLPAGDAARLVPSSTSAQRTAIGDL